MQIQKKKYYIAKIFETNNLKFEFFLNYFNINFLFFLKFNEKIIQINMRFLLFEKILIIWLLLYKIDFII